MTGPKVLLRPVVAAANLNGSAQVLFAREIMVDVSFVTVSYCHLICPTPFLQRNNIERHVWTQHLRIKLKMPEVRYFARTFKHYVDPYVQEVKDGRIRQRGRRAKCGPAKINTGMFGFLVGPPFVCLFFRT